MANSLDGILIVNKPANKTSHDIVDIVRRILNIKKIGHTGTLDPMATGVLVLLIGKATRIGRFLPLEPKEYIAEAMFGIITDTQDITGKIIEDHTGIIPKDDILEILPKFVGEIKQIPPMVSAIKVGGKKLYELARQGKEIERAARKVHIYNIELMDYRVFNNHTKATLKVRCSGGTYIRTLIHDIGLSLKLGATLSALQRIQVGAFTIKEAISLEELQKAKDENLLAKIIIPMNNALQNLPAIIVKDEYINILLNGRELNLNAIDLKASRIEYNEKILTNMPVRLLSSNNVLLSIGVIRKISLLDGILQIKPDVVFK